MLSGTRQGTYPRRYEEADFVYIKGNIRERYKMVTKANDTNVSTFFFHRIRSIMGPKIQEHYMECLGEVGRTFVSQYPVAVTEGNIYKRLLSSRQA